ncbi:hypothetical protein JMUB3870_2481 [Leptotrichia trevisanii]|uniref:Uncharacterized protein n=1 Tax=Leptotrichia trevisanii TaxID=109328 RepID=A0A510K424_9FUSO|nr:hypothetical protein JMUB3870_2481 [Leptotrichia trevisanii]
MVENHQLHLGVNLHLVRKLEVKNLVINSSLEEEKNSSLKIKSISILITQFLDEKRRNGLCQSNRQIQYLKRSLAEYKNIA